MSPHVDLGQQLRPRPYGVRKSAKPMVEKVYEFIVKFKGGHDGNSPTIREIGDACGISSTSVVVYWLIRLEDQGLIRRPEPPIGNRYACKIEVVGGEWVLDG
jgi:SOS-response transcriptional repressor LexA